MTRLALLADIHGNFPALEAVIADLADTRPDHVIIAGDVVNGVPMSGDVLDAVIARGWTALRGNHEFYLLNYLRDPASRPDLKTSMESLVDELGTRVNIIAALPDDLTLHYPDATAVRVFHGLPRSSNDAILPDDPDDATAAVHLANVTAPTYLCGHFHISFERRIDGPSGGWHVVNPGPVGMPGDGLRTANYALLESADTGWQVTFRKLAYDFNAVERAFTQHGMLDRLGPLGLLRIEQFRQARQVINDFYRWKQATHPDQALTFDLVETYLALPPETQWQYFQPAYRVNRHLMG
ncbi:MAG: metallophosphoesterase family protein [Chloroflexota bacterium]